ncbi:fimbria/pilus outer membrane usher protein [Rahnella ecdela]|uniref:Fimbrial biogenesis outer membrane usher protein n=1 Tax=Rahnella ecdela TaxID=2816250 RepID=A0ABS6LDY6_9GAMM|nr:fimbria/pilus outer membrane usher protein [Rahnella ecdela]MBU9844992.1 fimbrial biogenesis outer membrane usher protein [Rahnella ecdela]
MDHPPFAKHPACCRHQFHQHRLFLLFCMTGLVNISAMEVKPARAAEAAYFDPNYLQRTGQETGNVDLSVFTLSDKAQVPGVYDTVIYVNHDKVLQQKIRYDALPDGSLAPQISTDLLRSLGVRVDAFPTLSRHQHDAPLGALTQYIPAATATLDFNRMRLDVSIPQAAMDKKANGYVDPQRWDDGVPVLFSNYSFSGAQRKNQNSNDDSNQYLNLQNGFNAGAWRFRNYSTYSSSDGQQSWDAIASYVQRDIKRLKSQLLIGESATPGDLFPSLQFTGIQLSSDDNMLPDSQRGFAPTIRGIASSNAEVTVRQDGYIIYQSYVAPGAFEINDLYPSSYSGDMEVTIKEADGSERKFNQPFSAVPIMQRPGRLKYSTTFGKYRSTDNEDNEPDFAQGTVIYGISNEITVYAGTLASPDYLSGLVGTGFSLLSLGSISFDMTHAQTQQDDGQRDNGQSYRIQYSKNVESTDTNLTLASYRYSTSKFYDFDEANQRQNDNDSQDNHKRSKLQLSINQTIWEGASLYVTAYKQSYWGGSEQEKNLSFGLNTSLNGISYNVSYSYSKLQGDEDDQQIALNIRIPLSRWLPNSWATYNATHQKGAQTRQQAGLTGTLLDDNRLSYSLQQSHANQGGSDSSSLNASYRSAYGTLNTGYYYDKESQQTSYGLAGGIVAHSHGITLSQPLGDSFALIDTNGASGARVQNIPGVKTDWRGFAVVPYLTSYTENHIVLDTATLPADVDVTQNSELVIPNKGAMVVAHFDAHVGVRALITLIQPGGKKVPFGAVAVSEDQTQENIVDDGGLLYLSGIKTDEPSVIHVKWGTTASQQCKATLNLQPAASQIQSVTASCL